MHRRNLLKLLGAMGFGAGFATPPATALTGSCVGVAPKPLKVLRDFDAWERNFNAWEVTHISLCGRSRLMTGQEAWEFVTRHQRN